MGGQVAFYFRMPRIVSERLTMNGIDSSVNLVSLILNDSMGSVYAGSAMRLAGDVNWNE